MACLLSEAEFDLMAESRPTISLDEDGGFGVYSRFSPAFRAGGIRLARVDMPGRFQATVADFDLREKLQVTLEDRSEILLTFFTQGDIQGRVSGHGNRSLNFRHGYAMLRAPNRQGFVVDIPDGGPSGFVQIRLDRSYLIDCIRGLRLPALDSLCEQLSSDDGRVLDNQVWAVETELVLRQIAEFRFAPAAFLPYLKTKARELLTLFLCELAERYQHDPHLEQQQLAVAIQRIMLQDLANAPTLEQLTRHFSLSSKQLQSAFRTTFGKTPYAYLRHQRLEHARGLLTDSPRSILQIVQDLGWSCPSRFAAAFRLAYGISPKAYREQKKT